MAYNRLTKAFNDLRKLGYWCKANHTCCSSCGWAEIPEDRSNKAVFYHAQDRAMMLKTGDVFLAWDGDGNEIVKTIEATGLQVEWDGTPERRIKVLSVYGPDWTPIKKH